VARQDAAGIERAAEMANNKLTLNNSRDISVLQKL